MIVFVGMIELLFISCNNEHKDIFGERKVSNAIIEYIDTSLQSKHTKIDKLLLTNPYEHYSYRFFSDSTFERGKPNVKVSNVVEAHGKFTLRNNNKEMIWILKWDSSYTDSVKLIVETISPTKIVFKEPLPKLYMVQTLNRND